MHGAGDRRLRHSELRPSSTVWVLTNKMPASLIRGFGGPQLYLALERAGAQDFGRAWGSTISTSLRRNLVPPEKVPLSRRSRAGLYDLRRLSEGPWRIATGRRPARTI